MLPVRDDALLYADSEEERVRGTAKEVLQPGRVPKEASTVPSRAPSLTGTIAHA